MGLGCKDLTIQCSLKTLCPACCLHNTLQYLSTNWVLIFCISVFGPKDWEHAKSREVPNPTLKEHHSHPSPPEPHQQVTPSCKLPDQVSTLESPCHLMTCPHTLENLCDMCFLDVLYWLLQKLWWQPSFVLVLIFHSFWQSFKNSNSWNLDSDSLTLSIRKLNDVWSKFFHILLQ
jgi:hypothetical protein